MSLFDLTASVVTAVDILLGGPVGPIDMPAVAGALTNATGRFSHEIVYEDGSPAGQTAGSRSRPVRLDELPETYLQAIISAEDSRFFEHRGVDPVALGRILLDVAMAGRPSTGASTITQQLIKNALLGSDRTVDRKLREILLAVALEWIASKEEILETYLNIVYFGRGVWGIGDAAVAWFGRPIETLDEAELAFLAGVIQAPTALDPVRHPERALRRRDYVLDRMLEDGAISREVHDAAVALPLEVVRADTSRPAPTWISHHVEALLAGRLSVPIDGPLRITTTVHPELQASVQDLLAAHLHDLAGNRPWPLARVDLSDGLDRSAWTQAAQSVFMLPPDTRMAILAEETAEAVLLAFGAADGQVEPLDLELQDWDEQTIRRSLVPGDVLLVRDGRLLSVPPFQGSAVVMDARTGRVLALSGGYDPWLSAFDRSLAMRQPGSAIKPFLYLAAIEDGLQFDELLLDRPIEIPQPNGTIWAPRNFSTNQFSGPIPAFRALERSLNVVAARLVYEYGLEGFAAVTEGSGIYDRMPREMSTSLGAAETTLIRLAGGFAMLANGGYPVTGSAVLRIESGQGELLWEQPGPGASLVADPESVAIVDSMLRGVVIRGTAGSAFSGNVAVAGKTGTSQDYRDAWFVGFTPDLVVGVWVGNDDNTPLGRQATGGRLAATLVSQIFDMLNDGGFVPRGAPWPLLDVRPSMASAPTLPTLPAVQPMGLPTLSTGAGTGGLY